VCGGSIWTRDGEVYAEGDQDYSAVSCYWFGKGKARGLRLLQALGTLMSPALGELLNAVEPLDTVRQRPVPRARR
jgi:hypothetical protein